ncbi:MAG: helix-turn-helix domain-containing protein, partial [Nocardioidaceae bacterium]
MPGEEIATLVDGWLDWSEVAAALGVSVGKVRRMIRDHELAAVVLPQGGGPRVPAELLQDGQVVKGVPG